MTDLNADVLEKVDRLEGVVYRGNGKPGLVTRVALLEDAQRRWEKIAWLLLSASVLSLAGVIVDNLAKHWK